MTNEEIKNYFGNFTTYSFDGKLNELDVIMQEAGVGYNTLVANYGQVYFVCPAGNCPANEKITEIN
jgi:hypothetical protein